MRKIALILASFMLVVTSGAPAFAAPCRDAKGKFIKCPTKPVKAKRCRNAAGKFAKCGTPGAKPV